MSFFQEYKVLIFGSVTAVLTALYGLLATPVIDYIVLGYAAFIAVGSYLARNLRGQWGTIVGIVLPTIAVLEDAHIHHTEVNYPYLIVGITVQILAALSAPAKDRSYENSPTIIQAKAEGAEIKAVSEQKDPVSSDNIQVTK